MNEQIWIIDVYFSASFYLVANEEISAGLNLYSSVKKLRITPEFDDTNKQTGVFNLNIEFSVKGDPAVEIDSSIVADSARDILNYYINILAFLTGDQVKKVKPTTLKYNYPLGGKSRNIIFEIDSAYLIPPIPLYQTDLIKNSLETNISRCLAFYRYAIDEKDVLISTFFLLSALDLASTQFEVDSKILVTCDRCGFEKEIGIGTKSKVKYAITTVAGLSDNEFKDIWDLRNSISHGFFEINSKNLREIQTKRSMIRTALIKVLKKLIGLDEGQFPVESSKYWFADPIMCVLSLKEPPIAVSKQPLSTSQKSHPLALKVPPTY